VENKNGFLLFNGDAQAIGVAIFFVMQLGKKSLSVELVCGYWKIVLICLIRSEKKYFNDVYHMVFYQVLNKRYRFYWTNIL